MTEELPLEDQLLQRMRAWQADHPNGGGPRDPVFEDLLYRYLYRELPGIAALLPGLGWQANHAKGDYSCRFTSVLNKAFLQLLERDPTFLLTRGSLQQVRGFVSRTMSNMMLNHYQRKQTFRRKIEQFLGMTPIEQSAANAVLARLVQERAGYFEERTGVSFERGLREIAAWEAGDDSELQVLANILRLRYCDGLGYAEIAARLDITKTDVENALERAKSRLRQLREPNDA